MDNDNSIEEEVDNSNVSEQQWTQLSFAEDIDLDGMRQVLHINITFYKQFDK